MGARRTPWRIARIAVASGAWLCAHVANAQRVAVFAVTTREPDGARTVAVVTRAVHSVGTQALGGAALAHEIARHEEALDPVDRLAAARTAVTVARRQWSDATDAGDDAGAQRALLAVERAAGELALHPADLAARAADRDALASAYVFLAERYDAGGDGHRAEEAMRRLAALDPSVALTAREASPSVREHYAHALATMPRGRLLVQSSPAACAVERDGRPAGNTPVELDPVAPGEHRITVVCEAVRSHVHLVTVAAGTRTVLTVDPARDAALALDPSGVSLRYDTEALRVRRGLGDAVSLARTLGVLRAVAVDPITARASVIDVSSGAVVGEGSVDDAARLNALVNGPVASLGASRPRSTRTVRRPAPVAGIVVASAGLGITAGAVVLSVLADDARANAMLGHADERIREFDLADTYTGVSVALYAVGGLAVVGGIVWAVLAHTDETVSEPAAWLFPTADGVGVAGRF